MEKQRIDQFELYATLERTLARKIRKQVHNKSVLPPPDVDFRTYFETNIPQLEKKDEEHDRRDLELHYEFLRRSARGRPETVALHMLLISYLRRDTPYTSQAWSLFDRLWREYTSELLDIITPRELISAFRTFADHEPNRERKLLAKLCFAYGHMIKLYESERLFSGQGLMEIDFDLPQPCPTIRVNELWGVRYGGDNSFEILHLELFEEIMEDDVIGPMLLKFMWCVQQGNTIFSRYDRARFVSKFRLDKPGEWSFGFNPFKPLDEQSAEP